MNIHLHIDAGILIDGTNELLPESKKDYCEAQANLTEIAEDPNQCSEEPNATFDSAQEGKPRCITHYFPCYIHLTICIYCNNFTCAFTFSRH